MSRHAYVVEQHRYLLRFFAAKNPWGVLWFMLPLLAFGIHAIVERTGEFKPLWALAAIPAAYLYWTFIEYLIHRFYFHWNPRQKWLNNIVGSFHLYHHETPDDLGVITSGWVTGVAGAFLHFGILWGLTGGNTLMALYLTTALMVVYFAYEWVHYLVHLRLWRSGPLKWLQDFHLTHHVRPRQNYGQVSPIWDHVFRTHAPSLNTAEHPRMRQFLKQREDAGG